ncbi:MAG: DMT family transporter [Burkholderiales bacterium]|nr:DMT family transporter [Burkholderiales bacterium]
MSVPPPASSGWRTYALLGAGVAVVSTASILIRYAQADGAPSLAIAALRLGIATVVLTLFIAPRLATELPRVTRRDLLLAVASGGVLAVHFAAWISSLAFTSVASSAALVTTNPVWVGIASLVILRERLAPAAIVGVVLGLGGSVLVLLSDQATGETATASQPLLGNGLALLGAVMASAYLLIGRGLRARVSLQTYVWLVYAAAAVVLCLLALVAGAFTAPWGPVAWACMVGLALGPQLIGHTTLNWALRRVSATLVALAILGEPVGAALLAWLLFDETFTALQLAGFALLLAGIFVAARGERTSP